MKKTNILFPLVIALVVTVNGICLFGSQLYAQRTNVVGDLDCKWSKDICPDNNERQICLKDGEGDKCSCGDVSCTC